MSTAEAYEAGKAKTSLALKAFVAAETAGCPSIELCRLRLSAALLREAIAMREHELATDRTILSMKGGADAIGRRLYNLREHLAEMERCIAIEAGDLEHRAGLKLPTDGVLRV